MDWQDFGDDDLNALADAIIRVARELGRSLPPPPGMPLFGLDMTLCDPAILDRFSEQGIFRKYQRAVSLGCGLGGVARWWSARFGCSVVCVDRPAALIEAATRLGEVVRAGADVAFQAGDPGAPPLDEQKFTNAWYAGDLEEIADPGAFLAEVFRLLRPGGFLAVRAHRTASPRDGVEWLERLRATGFYGLSREVLPPLELPAAVVSAERSLDAFLAREVAEPIAMRLREATERMRAERRDERPNVLLFAERPA